MNPQSGQTAFPSGRAAVVLLSGGIDSAVVAALLLGEGWAPEALFIDYGQPAVRAEARASSAIANHFDLPYSQVTVQGLPIPSVGEIPGRNDLLLALARAYRPGVDIALGVHDGTGYADCSPAHHEAWQQIIDLQEHGVSRLLAPLLSLDKPGVFGLASELGIPVHLSHSCEAGDRPCGHCPSCGDRAHLGGRP